MAPAMTAIRAHAAPEMMMPLVEVETAPVETALVATIVVVIQPVEMDLVFVQKITEDLKPVQATAGLAKAPALAGTAMTAKEEASTAAPVPEIRVARAMEMTVIQEEVTDLHATTVRVLRDFVETAPVDSVPVEKMAAVQMAPVAMDPVLIHAGEIINLVKEDLPDQDQETDLEKAALKAMTIVVRVASVAKDAVAIVPVVNFVRTAQKVVVASVGVTQTAAVPMLAAEAKPVLKARVETHAVQTDLVQTDLVERAPVPKALVRSTKVKKVLILKDANALL